MPPGPGCSSSATSAWQHQPLELAVSPSHWAVEPRGRAADQTPPMPSADGTPCATFTSPPCTPFRFRLHICSTFYPCQAAACALSRFRLCQLPLLHPPLMATVLPGGCVHPALPSAVSVRLWHYDLAVTQSVKPLATAKAHCDVAPRCGLVGLLVACSR